MKSIIICVLFHTITFGDERSFEYNSSLFVSLILFGGELVNPTEFCVAVLTGDVSNHMPSGQHYPVLNFTIGSIQRYH